MLALALCGCASSSEDDVDEAGTTGGEDAPSSDTFDESPAAQCEDGAWPEPCFNCGEDGAEDTAFGMGDDQPLPMSVYSVQQGEAPFEQPIVLEGVLITSPAAIGEALGGQDMFVQELDGGLYSGMRVQASTFDLDAHLQPGDTANIVGRVAAHEGFFLLVLEGPEAIEVVGSAEPPPPPVVAVADLAAQDVDARGYEGVIVRVENGTVTDDDPCDGEFTLEDIVRVDDRFMPQSIEVPQTGAVVAAVEGVVIFAEDSYELAPPDPSAIE